jgi:hypothetical protein
MSFPNRFSNAMKSLYHCAGFRSKLTVDIDGGMVYDLVDRQRPVETVCMKGNDDEL